ncbi:hypothetical protein KKA17_05325 [bacterium]|nr:hypothetical protein [bacterium]MBU1884088.1 hypothetical protein [bacterium]
MTKTVFMDTYPVFSIEIPKKETTYKNVDEIIEYLECLIGAHKIAQFIAVFDHYEHTKSIKDNMINPEIKDAKNLIFCFGKQLPNCKMLAVRPRSIGICELENSFSIDMLQVPNEELHQLTEKWIKSIANLTCKG